MIHIIYIYLILVALFMGISSRDNTKWYEYLYSFIDVLIYPFVLIYWCLNKLWRNDYIFFIRIILGFKKVDKYNDALFNNIKMRRNLRGKLWKYLADKVVIKLK